MQKKTWTNPNTAPKPLGKAIKLSETTPSFIILACDGLWDVMEDQQAVDFVLRYQHERNDISQHLVNEALRRGSTDNVTVVVAWL